MKATPKRTPETDTPPSETLIQRVKRALTRPTGQLILRAPEIDPHPLTRRAPFVVTPRRFTLEMVQVDLTAAIPDDALPLLADPTDAAALLRGPLVHCIREIEAHQHRDDFSAADFRRMASAVFIDHRGSRGMKPITLLFWPDAWQDVEAIASHFGTDPQAVLRAAMRIAVDRKRAEAGPRPIVTATRAKARR